MKNFSTSLCNYFLMMCLVFVGEAKAQDVGIGTLVPDHKLHIAGNTSTLLKLDNTTSLNTGIMSEMYFKTGTHYTGAVKTIGNGTLLARLGFFTYAATVPSGLLERMSIMDNGNVGIGTNTPAFIFDVNGRMRVRSGGGNAGIHFMDAANTVNRGLVGMKDDNTIGFYGTNGGGWGLTMSTNTGEVIVNNTLQVIGGKVYATYSEDDTGEFSNYSGQNFAGVKAVSASDAGHGTGVHGEGGEIGLYGIAQMSNDIGHNYGVKAYGNNGQNNNYGIYASANGGNSAIGVYGYAAGGNANWGGYFSGSVYSSGSYQGSDRKLKSDIQPLNNALQLVKALKPSTYLYKTKEYEQMQLPEGKQYGLIADEVKQLFPSMVKQAVQPAKYEKDDQTSGRIIANEVSFEAVNYTAMIPILIAAMQEQQAMIDAQQKRIEELEARMK